MQVVKVGLRPASELAITFLEKLVEKLQPNDLGQAEEPILLTEENAVVVRVNGEQKQMAKAWLEDGGRGAGTSLAFQVLGTPEGLEGTMNLAVDADDAPFFDLICIWLQFGRRRFRSELTVDNEYHLRRLADYFCLDKLQRTITAEFIRRENVVELKKLIARKREELAARARRRSEEGRCRRCRALYDPPPTYAGSYPLCASCRSDW